ncbi:hypothetical protein AB7W32_22590, partial [Providencia manganoxydans]
ESIVDTAGTYPNIAAGLAATANGKYFRVPQGVNDEASFIYYQNQNGVAVEVASLLGSKALLEAAVRGDGPNDEILVVNDKHGLSAYKVLKNGIAHPAFDLSTTSDDGFSVISSQGLVLFSSKWYRLHMDLLAQDIEELKSKVGTNKDIVSRLDAQALAYSQNVNNTFLTGIQRPVFDYNIVITYGQSLSTANEGWPALSKTAQEVGNVLMFGGSVRGLDRLVANWRPVGGSVLHDLVAVVQQRDTVDSEILTDEQVAELAVGAQNEGESFDVGAVNFWRSLQNDFHGVVENPNRKIVVLNCGVAGQTVEQLSKGASPELFSRIGIALNQLKSHISSITPNATMGVVCVNYAQGEYNYNGTAGGTQDKNQFLNLTKKLRVDINNVISGVTGQKLPPAFITYQTSGSWTVDSTNMA